MNTEELKIQYALGNISKLDEALFKIEQMNPIPWPDLKAPFPLLKGWIKKVDKKLGKVEKIFEEIYGVHNDGRICYVVFCINVKDNYLDDMSEIIIDGDNPDNEHEIIERIYKHLQITMPLLVYSYYLVDIGHNLQVINCQYR